jgi:lipopolysaccharide/colanic/teichoic acid biosynthesis glycosyltransferase
VIKKRLNEVISPAAVEFLHQELPLEDKGTKILSTTTVFNVQTLEGEGLKNLVNVQKINDIRYINKFFEAVNNLLPDGGVFIGCAETMEERRLRILRKFPKPLAYPYYFFDFLVKRVLPKTRLTRKVYFMVTGGRNRVISLPEVLGRLFSCGFEVVRHTEIDNQLWFIARKVKEPAFNEYATYGPFIKLNRLGREGKNIKVYKLRTMHPYSEYLQNYVYQMNALAVGGKFKDDFRVTSWGKLFRKLWLDELPMLINWLKGDLKLVGVRPLSAHYLGLYTEELRNRRLNFKPGLIPPFYVDMPKTLDEIMASESRYLESYEKAPFRTDFEYFFKALHNIFIKRARSN